MHISILDTVRQQVAPFELRLVVAPSPLSSPARPQAVAQSLSPTVSRQTLSPRKPPILPFLGSAKKWGFLTRSISIFIEHQVFPPVTRFSAVQIPCLSCRPLLPCDIVRLSNARLEETSPTSRTERQKKHGYR